MVGPVFCIFLRCSEDGVIRIARHIAEAAARLGYGTIFGTDLIGCWDSEQKKSLESLENKLSSNLVVSITSHPLQTSAAEIFNLELNPMNGATRGESQFPRFLRSVGEISGIESLAFVISEDPWMSADLPLSEVSLDGFLSHLSRYHVLQADSRSEFGGDGVFLVRREEHD